MDVFAVVVIYLVCGKLLFCLSYAQFLFDLLLLLSWKTLSA